MLWKWQSLVFKGSFRERFCAGYFGVAYVGGLAWIFELNSLLLAFCSGGVCRVVIFLG